MLVHVGGMLVACWWLIRGMVLACWWLIRGMVLACWLLFRFGMNHSPWDQVHQSSRFESRLHSFGYSTRLLAALQFGALMFDIRSVASKANVRCAVCGVWWCWLRW
jgi:hypothetical protein